MEYEEALDFSSFNWYHYENIPENPELNDIYLKPGDFRPTYFNGKEWTTFPEIAQPEYVCPHCGGLL